MDLGGMTAITIEGWVWPTTVETGEHVVIIGQYGTSKASAAVMLSPKGQPAVYLSDTEGTDEAKLLLGRDVLPTKTWTHLALTYDGADVQLWVNGANVASRPQARVIARTGGVPFRIGASADAPGISVGLLDGRVDGWTVWPTALGEMQLDTRMKAAATADPDPENAGELFYAGFEKAYGPGYVDATGSVAPVGVVRQHGTPRVAGVNGAGHALRLNSDQVIDAGWEPILAYPIPLGTPSGLYAVYVAQGPTYAQFPSDDLEMTTIAIRPGVNDTKNPIAVVLPSNTWIAYNRWPQDGVPGGQLSRRGQGMTGNNSAYDRMGDGSS